MLVAMVMAQARKYTKHRQKVQGKKVNSTCPEAGRAVVGIDPWPNGMAPDWRES